MKALVVVGLWALSGSYFGGLVERITGLGLTIPVMAAFAVAGICLGLRIMMAGPSANGSRAFRVAVGHGPAGGTTLASMRANVSGRK